MVQYLTSKQKKILDFITLFCKKEGYAPTLTEIARNFKKSSPTIHHYIKALHEKGFLDKADNIWRGIMPQNSERISQPDPIMIYKFINQVIENDCLKVMPYFPDKSIDMILCDLPFGITQNKWDSIISLDRLWKLYERIIKDDGVIVLNSQGVFTAKLILSNEKIFKYKITWIKSKPTNFLNAKKQPLRKHEDLCVFYKNQPTYHPQMSSGVAYNKGIRKNQLTGSYGEFNPVEVKSDGSRYPTDTVYFKTSESEGRVYHPTQKPVSLGRYLIRTYTDPGDIILDNTCGSGSYLVAAILEGRKFIGIEKNREVFLHKKTKTDYISVCRQRIQEAQNSQLQFL